MLMVPKLQIQHIQWTRNTATEEIDLSFRSKVSTLSSALKHHVLKYRQSNNKTHQSDTEKGLHIKTINLTYKSSCIKLKLK